MVYYVKRCTFQVVTMVLYYNRIIKEENDTMANERKKKAYNHKRLEELRLFLQYYIFIVYINRDIERLAKEKEDVDRCTIDFESQQWDWLLRLP